MISKNDIKRFYSKIIYPDNDLESECWEFDSGIIGKGYKSFYFDKRSDYAHRFSFRINNNFKEICPNNYICHSCDNPGCVNPNHLFEGTPTDNYQDMKSKNRTNIAVGNRIPTAQITEKDVIDILTGKYPDISSVCRTLKVSRNIPENILKGRSWKHITKNYDLEKVREKIVYTKWNRPSNTFNEQNVRDIKERLKNGEKVKYIAKKYNVTIYTIYGIKNGHSWKHI